jgi:Ca2+-binding RTX toxin-like protein
MKYLVLISILVVALCASSGSARATSISCHEWTTCYGTDSADTMTCLGPGPCVMYGRGGNDTMYGHNSNDSIFGNAGADEIYGGLGTNHMHGGGGNDFLSASAGRYIDCKPDEFDGGTGTDTAAYVANIGNSFTSIEKKIKFASC